MEGLYDAALESGDRGFLNRVFDNWLDRYEGTKCSRCQTTLRNVYVVIS